MQNLLAFAAGLDPWIIATASNGGIPIGMNSNGYLAVTFTRLKNAPNLSYAVEVCGDLATWSSGAAYTTDLSLTSLDATRDRVTVRDNIPISGASQRAIRLRVHVQP